MSIDGRTARIAQRRAIEALRSGVPNRDAVRALGCAQPKIEDRFRQQLESAQTGAGEAARGAPGLLVVGGFGAGKSHLFECLRDVALSERFVCSKVVISKETPLHDPVKFYRAAIEAAAVPGRLGGALAEIANRLDFRGDAYRDLYDWVHHPGGELDSRFAATLFLFQRARDPELQDRIVRFWSGEPIGVGELKKLLREVRESVTYPIEKVTPRELALQRFRFATRLMTAAGYAGWVLLVDEMELIGRYSLLQRAKAYAEVARWMRRLKGPRGPGPVAVLAITDDFQGAILEEKDDLEKVPNKLRARGGEADLLLAEQAELGMRIIQREGVPLVPPDDAVIAQTYERVRAIHAEAYAWTPPPVQSVERLGSTRMREYVKGWITEWDLRRLDPTYDVQLEADVLRPDYAEDPDLEVPSEEEPGAPAE